MKEHIRLRSFIEVDGDLKFTKLARATCCQLVLRARSDRQDDEDSMEPSDQDSRSAEKREGSELAKQFYEETIRRKGSPAPVSDTESSSSAVTTPKFTGRSLFSEPSGVSNQKSPYEQEINLASTFQRTLPLQAAALAAAIAFVIYIGFSGGITDGSERSYAGVDEIDEVSLEIYNIRGDNQAEIDSASSPSPLDLSPLGGVYL